MKKNGLIIGLVILVLIGAGIVWLIVNKTSSPSTHNNSSNNTSGTNSTDNSATQTVQSGNVAVAMQDEAFSPQSIKIKKGTKVTWTNNDSMQHNVVADDASNAAGLPTDNELFGKGGTYSFTFNTTGTFSYHCTVHPFMTGSVEVVD